MHKNEIQIGWNYRAKVSGRVCTVKVLDILYRGWPRKRQGFLCKNLDTGREVYFKSALKFVEQVTETV